MHLRACAYLAVVCRLPQPLCTLSVLVFWGIVVRSDLEMERNSEMNLWSYTIVQWSVRRPQISIHKIRKVCLEIWLRQSRPYSDPSFGISVQGVLLCEKKSQESYAKREKEMPRLTCLPMAQHDSMTLLRSTFCSVLCRNNRESCLFWGSTPSFPRRKETGPPEGRGKWLGVWTSFPSYVVQWSHRPICICMCIAII